MDVRYMQAPDIPALQSVLDQTELFPSEMLPDMASDFLKADRPEDLWLACEVKGVAIGFCYARPEMLADGTWNMLAIAVHPDQQGKGVGAALTRQMEQTLKQSEQRVIIVDTSSTDSFANTRAFYTKNGYTQEARIRDFWAPGDDKVIFWKRL
ncbi:MAG: GNAT family N-acetyltransferase [Sulfitobacter sp.]